MQADMADNEAASEAQTDANTDLEPLSCVSCRQRKLKCDRTKPACARCVKVSAECVYPESRRKPTFKRKNVKELEARLAQVEGLLKDISGKEPSYGSAEDLDAQESSFPDFARNSAEELPGVASNVSAKDSSPDSGHQQNDSQLIGLGQSEALPPFEVMEELNNLFFAGAYHMAPVVHSGRYLQAFYGDPFRRPAMCLQYSIWALASHGHPKYDVYSDVFYRRARNYIHADEMRDDGEHFITIEHAQSWAILSTYEAKRTLFTRASMSCARSVRICQMMGLDRLDGGADDLPPALQPPKSWVELEERRRVFWGAFAIDCHASISTGWPCLLNAEDIMTRLPCSEAAFAAGQPETTSFLHEVFEGADYAGFAGTVVVCELYKSILRHVHRPKPDDNPEDLTNGGFWKRHRELDNQLSSIFMFLPQRFQLPAHLRDPGAVHLNLNLHASIICLHHAALELAEKHNHPQSLMDSSKLRLKTSAEEVVSIVRMTIHRTNIFKSPMCAISMYCAATVYVYMAKTDPSNEISHADVSNLEVIVHAMEAIGRTHQITRALLQQACMDIDCNGLAGKIRFPALAKYRNSTETMIAGIPLLARSPISRHTEIASILPGRLPLEKPQHLRANAGSDGSGGIQAMRRMTGNGCYQPVMGAVSRNIAGSQQPTVIDVTDSHVNKRKRTADSPAPFDGNTDVNRDGTSASGGNSSGGISWKTGPNALSGVFSLPDRSSSSTVSSPAYHNTSSVGGSAQTIGAQTDPMSGSNSNHGSPATGAIPVSGMGTSAIFGLGNTMEENRIDLSMFHQRTITPLWSSEEELFAAQIAESISLTGELPGGVSMPWNFFDNDGQL